MSFGTFGSAVKVGSEPILLKKSAAGNLVEKFKTRLRERASTGTAFQQKTDFEIAFYKIRPAPVTTDFFNSISPMWTLCSLSKAGANSGSTRAAPLERQASQQVRTGTSAVGRGSRTRS